MHQVVTGTGYLSNTIYVLLGLRWLVRTAHRDLAAIAWGVTLASRANFLFLVPLAFGSLRQHGGWRAATWATALTCLTVASLTLPFYLHDSANFGPLEAANRLLRFDTLFSHAGVTLMAVMAALSFGLSLTPMDRVALFRNCALVQAFPVVTGVVLSTVQRGRLDLAYAPYGTFFSWFALMAWAATATIRQGVKRGADHQSQSKRSKQELTRRRMSEKRLNQIAMTVEADRLPDDRHDPVGPREVEQLVNILVGQP